MDLRFVPFGMVILNFVVLAAFGCFRRRLFTYEHEDEETAIGQTRWQKLKIYIQHCGGYLTYGLLLTRLLGSLYLLYLSGPKLRKCDFTSRVPLCADFSLTLNFVSVTLVLGDKHVLNRPHIPQPGLHICTGIRYPFIVKILESGCVQI